MRNMTFPYFSDSIRKGHVQEIYPPEIKDFVYITDNAYTKDDILNMEA